MRKKDDAEAVKAELCRAGFPTTVYHASLPVGVSFPSDVQNKAKTEALESWSSDRCRIVVATIAFGMGINKVGGGDRLQRRTTCAWWCTGTCRSPSTTTTRRAGARAATAGRRRA